MSLGMSLLDVMSRKMVLAPYAQAAIVKPSWPKDGITITDPYYHDSKVDDYFHPSVHSVIGPKAIYHTLHPELRKELPKRESFFSTMTPLMGTIYHALIQQNLIHEGLVKPEDVEVSLVDEDRHWRGHADLIFKGELVDIKSMYSDGFRQLYTPKQYWTYQLHPYMDRLGKKSSRVLVVEQGLPWGMKEFVIKFDPELLKEIYDKWEYVSECLRTNTEPETCCKPGNETYCPISCKGRLYK